ncbi:MAG: hypothetical protein DWQ04_23615 [Chloroflexi bacterium]|nr:MAG: hypothetical protein DWQ04_23615 [Chloroflexota bacterium]
MTQISSQISKIFFIFYSNLRNLRLNPQNLRLNFFKLVISVLLICIGLLFTNCHQRDNAHIDPNHLKMEVKMDRLVRVTRTDLQSAGFEIDQIEADNLYLSSAETAVPYTIHNNALIFYGQAPTNRYTPTRVYMLETGKKGVLMEETAVSLIPNAPTFSTITQTQHFEQNNIYESRARTAANDTVWFWHKFQPDGHFAIDLNLPHLLHDSSQITISLWGLSSNPQIKIDHDIDVLINDHFLKTLQWDGAITHTETIIIPAGLLHSGQNQITFNNPPSIDNPVDIVLLDWIDLTVTTTSAPTNQIFTINTQVGNVQVDGVQKRPFLFNLTQPNKPQLLTHWQHQNNTLTFAANENQHYLVTTSHEMQQPPHLQLLRNRAWLEVISGADFVIVTTDALKTAVSPLKTQRESEGLQVAIVSIADLYDTFATGHETPQAIHSFLQHASKNWSPSPQYVLLVGDATTDYRSYINPPPAHHIPTLMVPVTFGGETISDARLADVDEDGRSDLALGRWPVNSKQEVTNLVKRTLAYEHQAELKAETVIVDPADPAFSKMADRLVINGRFSHTDTQSTPQLDPASWFAAYIGHGSLTQWGQTSILHQDQLPTSMPPIILQFTCLTGLFAHPTQPSLSETMLNTPNGPIVTVAATSLTLSQHQEPFANTLIKEIENPATTRIGDAFLHAQQSLTTTNNPALQDIHDTFILLSDPTTPILRPTSLTIDN